MSRKQAKAAARKSRAGQNKYVVTKCLKCRKYHIHLKSEKINAPVVPVPGSWYRRATQQLTWDGNSSTVPPNAVPFDGVHPSPIDLNSPDVVILRDSIFKNSGRRRSKSVSDPSFWRTELSSANYVREKSQ